jgi:mono/diheme cytochrome c family protein
MKSLRSSFRRIGAFGPIVLVTAFLFPLMATDVSSSPSSVTNGETVYTKSCSACHGENGDGKSAPASYLNPKPRNFTSGMFKFRSTPSGELPTDSDLLRIVDNGIPGTQMPAWKTVLTKKERNDVVVYLKTFTSDFTEGAPTPIAISEAPASTPELIQQGKMVYMLMECWACHGGKGRGDGKSGTSLKDDWGDKIKPWDLTSYRYKAGNDSATLYRTFTTGINGTPMPAYALDGFLIGGDAVVEVGKYKEEYRSTEVQKLKDWLRLQPTESTLKNLPLEQRNALGEMRKWALVYYIKSLIKKPNMFLSIFTKNTEVTQ